MKKLAAIVLVGLVVAVSLAFLRLPALAQRTSPGRVLHTAATCQDKLDFQDVTNFTGMTLYTSMYEHFAGSPCVASGYIYAKSQVSFASHNIYGGLLYSEILTGSNPAQPYVPIEVRESNVESGNTVFSPAYLVQGPGCFRAMTILDSTSFALGTMSKDILAINTVCKTFSQLVPTSASASATVYLHGMQIKSACPDQLLLQSATNFTGMTMYASIYEQFAGSPCAATGNIYAQSQISFAHSLHSHGGILYAELLLGAIPDLPFTPVTANTAQSAIVSSGVFDGYAHGWCFRPLVIFDGQINGYPFALGAMSVNILNTGHGNTCLTIAQGG